MTKSKFHKQFMTVTPLSRRIALLMVIALPFIGFYYGYNYPKTPSLVVSQQATPSVTAHSPEALVQEFYTGYVNCINKPGGSVPGCNWKNSSLVENSMADTLNQKKINITCSQNIPLGVVSQLASSDGRLATVNSYQIYEYGVQKIAVSLLNSAGSWKINDISCLK